MMGYQMYSDTVRLSVRSVLKTSQEFRGALRTLVSSSSGGQGLHPNAQLIRGDLPNLKCCTTSVSSFKGKDIMFV